MADLRERFRALDAVDAPDLRPEILERPVRGDREPPLRQRLAVIGVAASVAVLGISLGLWVFLRAGEAPQRLTEPPPTLPSQVEEVLRVEPLHGGVRDPLIPGWLIARVEADGRVWTLSVTARPEQGVLCLHLNSGVSCGGPTGPGAEAGPVGRFSTSDLHPPEAGVTFVYGPVVKRAVDLEVEFGDGTILQTTPIDGPPGFRVDFYLVGVRGTPRVDSVRVLDAQGRLLETGGGTGCRGPRVRISPTEGPVGTRVQIRGSCFEHDWDFGYGVFLNREFQDPQRCELIAGGEARLRVNKRGEARGYLIVPSDGACFQGQGRRRAVSPGGYRLGIGCHACITEATFRVTE